MSKSKPDKASEPENFGVFATYAKLLDALRGEDKEKSEEAWGAFLDRYGKFLDKIAKKEMQKKNYLRPLCDTLVVRDSATRRIFAKMVGDDPPEFRSDVEFRALLATIVYNRLVTEHRVQVIPPPTVGEGLMDNGQQEKPPPLRFKARGEAVLGTYEDGRDITLADLEDPASKTPLDELIAKEWIELEHEMMERLFQKLDDSEREIFRLREEGKKVNEIVKEVARPPRTVERKIKRIKEKIKELKEEVGK